MRTDGKDGRVYCGQQRELTKVRDINQYAAATSVTYRHGKSIPLCLLILPPVVNRFEITSSLSHQCELVEAYQVGRSHLEEYDGVEDAP
jgi:hypothetical protein